MLMTEIKGDTRFWKLKTRIHDILSPEYNTVKCDIDMITNNYLNSQRGFPHQLPEPVWYLFLVLQEKKTTPFPFYV